MRTSRSTGAPSETATAVPLDANECATAASTGPSGATTARTASGTSAVRQRSPSEKPCPGRSKATNARPLVLALP